MKILSTICALMFAAMFARAEVIPLSLSGSGGTSCVRLTVNSYVDTIRVTCNMQVALDEFSIYVRLESEEGATDSFYCDGNPLPAALMEFSVWDSALTQIIGDDTLEIGNLDTTKVTVKWDTVAAGSLPIPISLRDSTGTSSYPLNWQDNSTHYPFVLATEGATDVEGWRPPYSYVWDFYVHVGSGADQAILDFCIAYAFNR